MVQEADSKTLREAVAEVVGQEGLQAFVQPKRLYTVLAQLTPSSTPQMKALRAALELEQNAALLAGFLQVTPSSERQVLQAAADELERQLSDEYMIDGRVAASCAASVRDGVADALGIGAGGASDAGTQGAGEDSGPRKIRLTWGAWALLALAVVLVVVLLRNTVSCGSSSAEGSSSDAGGSAAASSSSTGESSAASDPMGEEALLYELTGEENPSPYHPALLRYKYNKALDEDIPECLGVEHDELASLSDLKVTYFLADMTGDDVPELMADVASFDERSGGFIYHDILVFINSEEDPLEPILVDTISYDSSQDQLSLSSDGTGLILISFPDYDAPTFEWLRVEDGGLVCSEVDSFGTKDIIYYDYEDRAPLDDIGG